MVLTSTEELEMSSDPDRSHVASKARGGVGVGVGNEPPGARFVWRFLLVLAFFAASMIVLVAFIGRALAAKYPRMVQDNRFDIDEFVTKGIGRGFPNPPLTDFDMAKVVFLHSLSTMGHEKKDEAIPISIKPSPFVKNLLISSRGMQDGSSRLNDSESGKKPIIVGTLRMGFGHHRIAYATASWGLASGTPTLFHDLLSIESSEADLIKRTDELYSRGSRIASELGGAIERIWGGFTSTNGDANALRTAYQLAEVVAPLLDGLDKDQPIIATHSLVGLTAVAAGFKNVVNLVIDNHPQWFLVVPGAHNLVQGPKSYARLLRLGVPESDVSIAGHWVPSEVVRNIEADTDTREARLDASAPLRILIPVGGAGAQRKFVTAFLESLAGPIASGEVQILLNAGDHAHMRAAFEKTLTSMGTEYELVSTMSGVEKFTSTLRGGSEPSKPVTLFAFNEYFPAVATTDLLARVSDVLACKPSELAFYPLPKLMLRRVGDHEADSALRATELGDGTEEIRDADEAHAWVELFRSRPSLLRAMNARVRMNARDGAYDGCKNAIAKAYAMAYSHPENCDDGDVRGAEHISGVPMRRGEAEGECTLSWDEELKFIDLIED